MRAMVVVMAVAGTAHAESPFPDLPKVALVDKVTATSTFSDKNDPTDYSAVRTILPETRGSQNTMVGVPFVLWSAWCEGKKDEGIGEAVTITFAEPTQIDTVEIAAGVWRTDALFNANNQITALDVIADGKSQTVKPSGKNYVEAKLGAKVTTLAFKIAAVKKGKMNDTCISEIQLHRDGKRMPIIMGLDPTTWSALPAAVAAIQKAIMAADKKGLDALVEWPLELHDVNGDKGYGGSKDASDANIKELIAACKVLDKKLESSDGWVDPLGCPMPANHDPDDNRGDFINAISTGVVEIMFQSHNEYAVTWRLHWSGGKWKLQAIGDKPW